MAKLDLKSIEQNIPWSFLGFVAAISFGFLGIYSVFIYEKAPELQLDILSSVPVLSINENVQDLEIIFEGENIIKAHRALTLVNFRLVNRGNSPIRPGDFDDKDPLTINLSQGEIVKADILEASDSYLMKVFAEIDQTDQILQFPPFILEPAEYISISLLVLHADTIAPVISVQGRIATVGDVRVIEQMPGVEKTKWSIALSGDLVIQSIRGVVYSLGVVVIIVIAILANDKIENINLEKKRQKLRTNMERRLRQFADSFDGQDNIAYNKIISILLRDDLSPFRKWEMQLINLGITARPEGDFISEPLLEKLLNDLVKYDSEFDPDYIFQSEYRMKTLIKILVNLVKFDELYFFPPPSYFSSDLAVQSPPPTPIPVASRAFKHRRRR